jgi:hypothetical protein
MAVERDELANPSIAEEETAPEKRADDDREDDVEKRSTDADVRRDGAAEVAGQ